MNTLYNRLAGQSVERLAALSDGIFAVAMTLLAIDLRLPAAELLHRAPRACLFHENPGEADIGTLQVVQLICCCPLR